MTCIGAMMRRRRKFGWNRPFHQEILGSKDLVLKLNNNFFLTKVRGNASLYIPLRDLHLKGIFFSIRGVAFEKKFCLQLHYILITVVRFHIWNLEYLSFGFEAVSDASQAITLKPSPVQSRDFVSVPRRGNRESLLRWGTYNDHLRSS